jgi:mono/diheme cytochrome c family protein
VHARYILWGAALIVFILSACNTHTERPPNPQDMINQGQQIYLEFCAECHQVDGMGWSTLYPRLAGNPIVTLHDPEPIIDTVLYGQGSMMSFREKLNNQQIAAVLSYIRNAWGNQAAAVSDRQIH